MIVFQAAATVLHSPDDEAAAAQHSVVDEMTFSMSFQ
jgi:hypothetical protein